MVTHVNGQTYWRSKVLISGLSSPEEKLKICWDIHSLSEKMPGVKAGKETLTPMGKSARNEIYQLSNSIPMLLFDLISTCNITV